MSAFSIHDDKLETVSGGDGAGVEESSEFLVEADKEKLAAVGLGDADRETKTGGYRKSTFRKWKSLFDWRVTLKGGGGMN